MRTYHHDSGPLAYAASSVKLLMFGIVALMLAGVLALGSRGLAPSTGVPLVGRGGGAQWDRPPPQVYASVSSR